MIKTEETTETLNSETTINVLAEAYEKKDLERILKEDENNQWFPLSFPLVRTMNTKKTLSRIAEVCLILGIVLIVGAVFAYEHTEKVPVPNVPALYYWATPYRQYTFPLVLGAIILSITGLASLIAVSFYPEPKEQQS
jgi:hypothetical protein